MSANWVQLWACRNTKVTQSRYCMNIRCVLERPRVTSVKDTNQSTIVCPTKKCGYHLHNFVADSSDIWSPYVNCHWCCSPSITSFLGLSTTNWIWWRLQDCISTCIARVVAFLQWPKWTHWNVQEGYKSHGRSG